MLSTLTVPALGEVRWMEQTSVEVYILYLQVLFEMFFVNLKVYSLILASSFYVINR